MTHVVRDGDRQRLLRDAGRLVCERVRGTLARRPLAVVAVPGGRSAAAVFRAMLAEDLDWRRVHFFVVDERLVPLAHPDSNFALLHENLVAPLSRAGRIDPGNAHPFVLDAAGAGRAAERYERELGAFGLRYDVVLLSAGEDGHVGALYPRHHSVEDPRHGFIVMDDSPKPPPGRMSSSASLVRSASAAVLLFVGESKRGAWARFNDERGGVVECPAKLVRAIPDTAVLTDLDA